MLGKRASTRSPWPRKDGVGEQKLLDAIAARCPTRPRSAPAPSRRKADGKGVGEFVTFIRYFLLAFGGIALFVGAFVIFNTLSITVAQRTKELATLRTLGASRRQVLRSVVLEGRRARPRRLGGRPRARRPAREGTDGALQGRRARDAAGRDGLPAADGRRRDADRARSSRSSPRSGRPSVRRGSRRSRPCAKAAWSSKRPSRKMLGLRPRRRRRCRCFGLVYGTLGEGVSTAVRILGIALGAFGIFIGARRDRAAARRARSPTSSACPAARLGGVAGRLAQENAVRNPGRTASTAAALMIGLDTRLVRRRLRQGRCWRATRARSRSSSARAT